MEEEKGGKVLGNVNLNIENCQIAGKVFGGGYGLTDNINFNIGNRSTAMGQGWDAAVTAYNNSIAGKSVSWNEAPRGFPIYNSETKEIITRKYHKASLNNGNYSLLEYGKKSYLTLAEISGNVNLNISKSTIGSNVYGGGSISVVESDVNIKINDSTIKGNIYGGGDGNTKPAGVTLYKPFDTNSYVPITTTKEETNTSLGTFNWTSDEDILTYFKGIYDGANKVIYNSDNTTTSFNNLGVEAQQVIKKYGTQKLIYSASVKRLGIVEGNTSVDIKNVTPGTNTMVYGGGYSGAVNGNTKVKIDGTNVKGIYGGGYSGKVLQDSSVKIDSGTIGEVFGGGYSGSVEGNTKVTILKGKYNNIFAGGDQAYVTGNTILIIGDEEDQGINIDNVAYGGGRGKATNGDASNFTTVYGKATVTIQGINTYVENYGSIKLGAVAGQVDVTFKNYWTGNGTQKYKTMNGIDRADNVYFDNSYVNLTNKDEQGNLLGIKSIRNLYVTEGNGLKVSASGEISGNFTGGGEMYLDSEVCLTIRGDIIGSTKLVLNPLLTDEEYTVKGGEDMPYMNVYGSYPESSFNVQIGKATALVSGDTRYEIEYLHDKYLNNETSTRYFIFNDIKMDDGISEKIKITAGKIYKEDESKWESNSVDILQNGKVTATTNLNYQFKEDVGKEKIYTNLERSLIIKSGNEIVKFPNGTELTMVTYDENGNESYYSYTVETNLADRVRLKDFKNMQVGKYYEEVKDITKVADGDLLTKTYTYGENFRFIVNFAKSEEDLMPNKTYNILLDITDDSKKINELSFISDNFITVYQKNNITYKDVEKSKEKILSDSNIIFTGILSKNTINDSAVFEDNGRNIVAIPRIKSSNGEHIEIPEGTIIKINGTQYNLNETEKLRIFENINKNKKEINNYQIELDFSKVKEDNLLNSGEYNFELTFYTEDDEIIYNKLNDIELTFNLINKNSIKYGIKAELESDSIYDKIHLFEEECSRNLKIDVNSKEIEGAKVKIKLMKKTEPFKYEEIKNGIVENGINNENLQEKNNLTINYNGKLEKGTYRILVELYDKFENYYTEDYVNIIII